jgi:hypothetical protein
MTAARRIVIERTSRHAGAFVAELSVHLHPPYGLWRVLFGGRIIGQQLSVPSLDDCERMLSVPEAPAAEGAAALTPDAIRRRRGVEASALAHRNRTAKAPR